MIVADASVLIALAKMVRLELLQRLYGQAIIGETVKVEVLDQGKAISAPGVEQMERALQQRWVRLVRLNAKERMFLRRLLSNSRLDDGEAEALSLAHSRGLKLIVDDKEARAFAGALGIAYIGTVGVLLEAYLKGHMTLEDFEQAMSDLSRVLWLSPAVVTEALKRAREAKR